MKSSATDPSLTVDVFALARTQGHREGVIALAMLPRLAPMLVSTAGTVAWCLDGATDAKGRPAARLTLRSELTLTCDKCGADLQMPVDSISEFWFAHSEEELERQPIDAAEEEPLLGGARFAVVQLVEDELILAIPISPRHPECVPGAPGVEAVDTHRPLAALAGLKQRGSRRHR